MCVVSDVGMCVWVCVCVCEEDVRCGGCSGCVRSLVWGCVWCVCVCRGCVVWCSEGVCSLWCGGCVFIRRVRRAVGVCTVSGVRGERCVWCVCVCGMCVYEEGV